MDSTTLTPDDHAISLKRLRFRAWHRGTKEADLLIGGFFDAHHAGWSAGDVDLFEQLLAEQDVDILAWAFGAEPAPARYEGVLMAAMRTLSYVPVER